MRSALVRFSLAVAMVWATALVSGAQQTSTASQTKNFDVIAVDGNTLVVKLPEGTREITVADDFRFTVDGQALSVHQLKPGMKGTATITTRTTVTPVTVTEVKNGTVAMQTGMSIIVRTDEGIKSFTQDDIDKRAIKIMRNGEVAAIADFREGDRLSATIITSKPPRVVTEQEVQATLARAGAAGGAGAPSAGSPAKSASTGSSASAAAKSSGTRSSASGPPASGDAPAGGKSLPKTASEWPLLALVSSLSLAWGIVLTIRRRNMA